MTDLLHAAGFLGTNGNWAADFTLIMMLLILGLFTLGAWLARQDKIEAHKWVQTVAAVVNLIFVLWLMVLPFRDFVVRDFGGSRLALFYAITSLHATAGFTALVFGWYVILRGHGIMPKALRFQNYKPFMRAAYGLYFLATVLGVIVYIVWFVVEPNTPVYG